MDLNGWICMEMEGLLGWNWMNGFEWRWIDIFGWMVRVYMVQVWRWMDNLGWIVRDGYARH